MIERSLLGRQTPPSHVLVEKGAIRRFAEAIGESNPLYYEESAAQAAGFSSLVAPPTFATTLATTISLRNALGVPEQRLLLSEEAIESQRPIVAGDRLTVWSRVADIQEREAPGGVLGVVTLESEGHDESGALVFKCRQQIIVRRGRE